MMVGAFQSPRQTHDSYPKQSCSPLWGGADPGLAASWQLLWSGSINRWVPAAERSQSESIGEVALWNPSGLLLEVAVTTSYQNRSYSGWWSICYLPGGVRQNGAGQGQSLRQARQASLGLCGDVYASCTPRRCKAAYTSAAPSWQRNHCSKWARA